MTDEELIARLRDDSGNWLTYAAAGRIKALGREKREAALDALAAHGQAHDAYEAQLKAEAYAEELEAKVKNLTKHHSNMADPRYWEGRYRDEKAALGKAVGALREIAAEASVRVETKKHGGISHKKLYKGWRKLAVRRIDIARAALAEIEGGKTDG